MNIKTTSFPLRWPPALKARAQDRAAALGLSLNGLVCVALDAYLSAPAAAPVPPPAAAPKAAPAAPAAAPRTAPAVAPEAAPAAPQQPPTMNREQRRAAKSKGVDNVIFNT